MTSQLPPEPSLESWIGQLLRLGVILSASVLFLGGTIYLLRHGHETMPSLREFHKEPPEYSRPRAIFHAVLEGKGRALIQLGVVLLIATPISRVVLSLLYFVRRRDLAYVGISLLVVTVLLFGLVGGFVSH